jgi:hypothetical protein
MKTMMTPIENNDNAAEEAPATTLLLLAADGQKSSENDQALEAKRKKERERKRRSREKELKDKMSMNKHLTRSNRVILEKQKDQTNKYSRKREEKTAKENRRRLAKRVNDHVPIHRRAPNVCVDIVSQLACITQTKPRSQKRRIDSRCVQFEPANPKKIDKRVYGSEGNNDNDKNAITMMTEKSMILRK